MIAQNQNVAAAREHNVAVTLKLEGSDMLLQALDDHMRTCELARQLLIERDALQAELTNLRQRYENQA